MAKAPQSGLRTVSRHFGSSQEQLQGQNSSQTVAWPASPPIPAIPTPAKAVPTRVSRLDAINQGIAAAQAEKETSSFRNAPLATSSLNKRRSSSPGSGPMPKKKRIMPSGWDDVKKVPSNPVQKTERNSSSSSGDLSLFRAVPINFESGTVAPVFLSVEQNKVLGLIKEGENVFYTGSAGTGKSVLLRESITSLRIIHRSPEAVAITAATGVAACNIGGTTLHKFAGFGIGDLPVRELIAKIKKNRQAAQRWRTTRVLIIDEVSMLDADMFDKLSKIGSDLRNNPKPFGGMQIIVTGDFFQLPPVKKSGPTKFAFEAEMWAETMKHTFNLTKVFRQHDQTFVNMLNDMRFGILSKQSIATFQRLARTIEYNDGIGPTELYPRREDVDRANEARLRRLDTQAERFTAKDNGVTNDTQKRLLDNMMAPAILDLRVDAQVMLIKNHDETLVNGSLGRVLRFVDPAIYSTTHDKEATTGESGFLGASILTTGVGTARSKTPNQVAAAVASKPYPVVEFILPRGGKRRVLVMPEVWKVDEVNGKSETSRSQLPLILSWAMSIHKSQGQTLDRVKVDLAKIFEKGQAYVALSRATSLEGLQVLNFNQSKVMAHPKVIEWSKSLSTISES